MTLSVLCVTRNEPHAKQFVLRMHSLATILGAELVLGLDSEAARRANYRDLANKAIDLPAHDVELQEEVSDIAVNACSGDWVLRLDDDEMVSPALVSWLLKREYESANEQTYSFPRVYLYPDAKHRLINDGIFPDLQTRLGRRNAMLGVTYIHAGNPHGPGKTIMYAIEHHKLLVKDYSTRKAIAERYERIRPGAGRLPEYARYNMPEWFYDSWQYEDYTDGDFTAR